MSREASFSQRYVLECSDCVICSKRSLVGKNHLDALITCMQSEISFKKHKHDLTCIKITVLCHGLH